MAHDGIESLNITVAGAGAIGCTLAARLAAAGQRLGLLAREATLTATRYRVRSIADPIGIVTLGAGRVRTSMPGDRQRGRPLELAAIGDSVIELAARYDPPMTATRALLERVRHAHADKTRRRVR